MALISRRAFVSPIALAGASVLARGVSQRGPWAQGTAPALVTSDRTRPSIPYGVASGDVTDDTAIIWSRTNTPSRMLVEYAATDSCTNARCVQGPAALAVSDFTARVELTDLPAGQAIFYRVVFQELADPKILSAPTLGTPQGQWLKRALLNSRATWKGIASDMPLGLQALDMWGFEAWADNDGPALGRELDLADLLRFLKDNAIKNVVWLTADVHYAAAHLYDPVHVQCTDFNSFWECVAGPLHAGTFGPQVQFLSIPPDLKPNRLPSDGLPCFGMIQVSGTEEVMTVSLHNLRGEKLYSLDLSPAV